jgi:hypothetical protein
MQGHSDNEDEEEPAQLQEMVPLLPAQPQQVAEQPQQENLMQLSLQALHGMPGEGTLSVHISIAGKSALALIDTRSTNTFLDLQFAQDQQMSLIPIPHRKMLVAGGGELTCEFVLPQCKYAIEDKEFTHDFHILPLKGYDIILAANWLKQFSPNIIDWEQRSVSICHNGRWFTLVDNQVTGKDCLISAKACSKLLRTGADAYILQLNLLSTTNQPTNTVPQTPTVPNAQIAKLLGQFQDVFSEPQGLPPHRSCDHTIPLQEGAKPPNIRPYRMPHKQKNIIEELVRTLLEKSEIRASTSPYSSPSILVRKRDKSWHLCVDYRQLNALTIKNKYPIPMIEDLLDELQGATIFSKLDLCSGYHQIRMNPSDIAKTTFRTHLGHYEYLVMPFGLTNVPATFQELMNNIFAQLLRKFVLVFFDDILVYSKTIQEHKKHMAIILQLLRQHKLSAKLSKCSFATETVEYLGHVLSGDGVATDPSKIVDILSWATPTTVTQLRGFLGLTRYY